MNRRAEIRRRLAAGALFLAPILLSGCGSDQDLIESPTGVRLRGVASVILDYSVNVGKGPPNAEALKKYIRTSMQSVQLTPLGIDPKDLEPTFVSLRDEQPFTIRWGVGLTVTKENVPLLAYEQTGKDGKRLVAYANGNVDVVDEARFKELTAAKP